MQPKLKYVTMNIFEIVEVSMRILFLILLTVLSFSLLANEKINEDSMTDAELKQATLSQLNNLPVNQEQKKMIQGFIQNLSAKDIQQLRDAAKKYKEMSPEEKAKLQKQGQEIMQQFKHLNAPKSK